MKVRVAIKDLGPADEAEKQQWQHYYSNEKRTSQHGL